MTGLLTVAAVLASWPATLPLLRRWRLRQSIREQGPSSHRGKGGTPTMAGAVFLPLAALCTWLAAPHDLALAVALVVMLGNAALGFVDDFIKSALGRPLGLRAREKLLGQVVLGLVLGMVARDVLDLGSGVALPFTSLTVHLGAWYIPFVVLLTVGTVNATNLTDGLDGLLAGSGGLVALGFGVIALAQGQGPLAALAAGLAGACLGFLRVNWHPAKAFMGDTGSLGIGGGLVALAVLTRTEAWLALLGVLFVLEALSVIVQVFTFHAFGRRWLRMSPLHHHFELSGWSEKTVVLRSWALTAAGVTLGLWGYLWR